MPGPTLPLVTYNKAKALKGRRLIAVYTPAVGVAQVEVATAVGAITTSGNVTATLTAAGVVGSPIALAVAVLAGDTPAMWAQKVRLALAANAAIAALYTVAPALDASITLTRVAPAADDATLNLALANGTSVGATAAPTSTTVVAGSSGGVPVNIIGKLGRKKGQTTVVASSFPDAEGINRDIDHLATEGKESVVFRDMEDYDTVIALMGGLTGLLTGGTVQIFICQPGDAVGKVRYLSDAFPCCVQRDGDIDVGDGYSKNPTLEFISEKLGKITWTPNADVVVGT